MHHQSVKLNSVKGQFFSIIHLVRTVCELTSSILQTRYTRTTLFCLHLQKSFSIKYHRTLSPKTMHRVCCFHWCWRVPSWTVVVWSENFSLVSCILPPLRRFRAATYHRQLQIQYRKMANFVKFRCKVDVNWFNKLVWPVRIGHILQPQKWLEICNFQQTLTPHQCCTIGFAGNELAFIHITISVPSGNSVSVFLEIRAYIHTAGPFPY